MFNVGGEKKALASVTKEMEGWRLFKRMNNGNDEALCLFMPRTSICSVSPSHTFCFLSAPKHFHCCSDLPIA